MISVSVPLASSLMFMGENYLCFLFLRTSRIHMVRADSHIMISAGKHQLWPVNSAVESFVEMTRFFEVTF